MSSQARIPQARIPGLPQPDPKAAPRPGLCAATSGLTDRSPAALPMLSGERLHRLFIDLFGGTRFVIASQPLVFDQYSLLAQILRGDLATVDKEIT